jgi:hypothetical protein
MLASARLAKLVPRKNGMNSDFKMTPVLIALSENPWRTAVYTRYAQAKFEMSRIDRIKVTAYANFRQGQDYARFWRVIRRKQLRRPVASE